MAKRFLLTGALLDLLVGTVAFTLPTAAPPIALPRSDSRCGGSAAQPKHQPLAALFLARSNTRRSPQLNQEREGVPRLRTTAMSASLTSESLSQITRALFRYEGRVPLLYSLGINVVLFTILRTKLLSALNPAGFFNAMGLGTMLWATLGWRGWSYCVLYLVFGQLVTKIRFADKEKRGLAEGRGGRRGPENVWGSAATSLFCAACAVQGPEFLGVSSPLLVLGFCAGLATKLADTFASEIGKAYGKTTFLITTFKRASPGDEGAVSLEGTVAAAVGGLLLSSYGLAIGLISPPMVAISTVSAFIATNVESYLGATIQEGKWITNEVINFFNTVIGAGIAICLAKAILRG